MFLLWISNSYKYECNKTLFLNSLLKTIVFVGILPIAIRNSETSSLADWWQNFTSPSTLKMCFSSVIYFLKMKDS